MIRRAEQIRLAGDGVAAAGRRLSRFAAPGGEEDGEEEYEEYPDRHRSEAPLIRAEALAIFVFCFPDLKVGAVPYHSA
jgi:hypothetical protein